MKGIIHIAVSYETAQSEEQHQAMVAALEFLFGQRKEIDGDVAAFAAGAFGLRMDAMTIKMGVKPGEDDEWRRVALSKWRHFLEMWKAYEAGSNSVHGNSHVALDFHAYSLAKMIPFLLGRPDLALPEPTRDIPRAEAFKRETHGNWNPHRNEERVREYPATGLDFTDTGYLPTGPVPDAFEHEQNCD